LENLTMRFRKPLSILIVSLTFAVLAPPLSAQRQPPAQPANGSLGQNAALNYWQAFAHLPRQLPAPGETGADPDEAKLLESSKDALLYLHRGAAIGPCDWGLHREDGPYLLLPHLAKGRDLGRLAGMKVRQDLAAGKGREAAQTAGDTLVMARHLSSDITAIVTYLVQLAVERSAVDSLAPQLGALDAAALESLDRRLASLPPGGSLETCLRVERELGVGWAIRELRKMNDQDPWKDRVLAPYSFNEGGPQPAMVEALAAAAGGTREGALKQFESLIPYLDELDRDIKLPRDEFRAKMADLENRVSGNPFAKAVLPAMNRLYDKEAAGRTRLIMLRAAVAALRGGPEKVSQFKDASGAPLEYGATADGFEVRSKVVDNDQPVVLKVGGKK
jgi:hypothetical protein